MLGILSSTAKKETHLKYFYHMLNSYIEYKDKSMFVFTIDDIDFLNKTVSGNSISKDGMEFIKTSIPSIIFNLTHHRKRTSIKKARKLASRAGVIMINEKNRFKQYMIMEMLSSNMQTQDIVLKYKTRMKKDIEKYKDGFFVLSEKGYDYSNTGHLSDKHKFIIFNKQDLLLHNDYPIIITLYAQRGIEGAWKVLPGRQNPEGIVESDALFEKIKLAAIESAEWISCFIPILGFSTVNFVLDKNFNPYLVSLNGWDPKILHENSDNKIGIDFMNNLFDYTSFLSIKQRGGVNHVD